MESRWASRTGIAPARLRPSRATTARTCAPDPPKRGSSVPSDLYRHPRIWIRTPTCCLDSLITGALLYPHLIITCIIIIFLVDSRYWCSPGGVYTCDRLSVLGVARGLTGVVWRAEARDSNSSTCWQSRNSRPSSRAQRSLLRTRPRAQTNPRQPTVPPHHLSVRSSRRR